MDEGLVVVGQQRALVGLTELPVEPDRGGQGEQPLGDADEHPAEGTATMLLQPELLLERVDDRLDPLPHPAQRPEPARLVLAIRPDEAGPHRSDVASSSRKSSHHDGETVARWRMARLSWWPAARRRLL